MSKSNRELTNRLEELFSTPVEPAASRPEPSEPAVPGKAGPVDRRLFEQTEASFVKAILEQLPMPVYVKDQDHKWVAVNPAFCRLIGKSADAIIGYTDKEQSDDDWQRDDQVFETGLADEMQQTLNQPAGSPLARSIRRVPLKNAAGHVDYLVTIIEDTAQMTATQITATQPAGAAELNKAREALQQSESFYHSLVEVMPQCICRKDLEGRFTFANRLFCEDLGRPLEDLIGKTDYDIHPPEMAEKYRRDDRRVIDTGQVFETVEERAVLGGENSYVQTIKSPIHNAEGSIIGVQIMFWDVTERKRAEETLKRLHDELEIRVQERTAELAKTNDALQAELTARRRAEAAMRDSEVRLNTAFDYSANGEALIAVDGTFLRVNRAWLTLLGYTEAEMLQLGFRDITHLDDIEASLQYLHKALAGELDSFQAEMRYLHKNGQVIWIQSSTAIVRDSQGQALYFISQINDFTRRKEAEERILRRNLELAAINRLGRELASQTEPAKIIELIYTTIGELIDNRNLYIALYDEPNQQISFPLYTLAGERRAVSSRPMANGMTEYLLRTKAPLLIPHDVEDVGLKLGIDRISREAQCWLGVPLLLGDKAIGVITLQDYDQADVYSAEHVELLTTIATQAAVALENARLFGQAQTALAETTRRSEQLVVLNEMGRMLGATLNVDAILNTVYTYTSRLMNTDSFFIALYDSAANMLSFPLSLSYNDSQPLRVESRPLKSGLTDYLIRQRRPLLLSDNVQARMAELGVEFLAFGNAKPALSWLGVPMIFSDQVLGAIVVQSVTTPNLYSEIERDLLIAIASQAAIAIQNARLFEQTQAALAETQQLAQREQTLGLITNRIFEANDIKRMLQITAEELRRATGSTRAVARLKSAPSNPTKKILPHDDKAEERTTP